AVDDVTFSVTSGGTLGLVGESGSGKTTVGRCIVRLYDPTDGRVEFCVNGEMKNLIDLGKKELKEVRKSIQMLFQDPFSSLNSRLRIKDIITEPLVIHEIGTPKERLERAKELLETVWITADNMNKFPHQFSGGMKQRSVIAMALLLEPDLIIADEPTTALDVLVQDQIILKIKELLSRLNNAMILITHDIAVVAETCERMVIMYAGKIMEYADTDAIFYHPYHPYTLGLQNAFPSVMGTRRELISIPGFPPSLIDPPPGCLFAERCPFAEPLCREQTPALEEVEPAHFSACHRASAVEEIRAKSREEGTWYNE
ncbi:hypothetical protein LCGC14_2720590, partial [marine sediment metagenome]